MFKSTKLTESPDTKIERPDWTKGILSCTIANMLPRVEHDELVLAMVPESQLTLALMEMVANSRDREVDDSDGAPRSNEWDALELGFVCCCCSYASHEQTKRMEVRGASMHGYSVVMIK
jgi:hypothetical protein